MAFPVMLLSAKLTASTSPEEKTAEYVENANALLQEGDPGKAGFAKAVSFESPESDIGGKAKQALLQIKLTEGFGWTRDVKIA